MLKKKIAYSNLPRTGIGNKLFIWAQGLVFSKINNCPHITTGWIRIHVGPLIRKEKSLRFYSGYVSLRTSLINWAFLFLNSILRSRFYLNQEYCDIKKNDNNIYYFSQLPSSENYFITIHKYRNLLKKSLYSYFSKSVLQRLSKHELPIIGVHIRLGDFKVGGQTYPISYYKNAINKIRTLYGQNLPATIFTDGNPNEIIDLLSLPNTKIADNDKDLVHLLLLSKSKIIVLTPNSTFSLWAGFISDALLLYDKSLTNKIRPNCNIFEGSTDMLSEETIKNHLQNISF